MHPGIASSGFARLASGLYCCLRTRRCISKDGQQFNGRIGPCTNEMRPPSRAGGTGRFASLRHVARYWPTILALGQGDRPFALRRSRQKISLRFFAFLQLWPEFARIIRSTPVLAVLIFVCGCSTIHPLTSTQRDAVLT